MKFTLSGNIMTFEAPASYPASRPVEKVQAIDRSATGSVTVESFGVDIKSRVLAFREMSKVDYDNLRFWYENVSNGAAEAFLFEDERGYEGLVRIMSNIYSFKEVDFELYSGDLVLEYV